MSNELQTGLFNLSEFIGYPVAVVNNYFSKKGWVNYPCFNDYKWVWINESLNKSIVVKVEIVDNDLCEIVDSINYFDGIYKENI